MRVLAGKSRAHLSAGVDQLVANKGLVDKTYSDRLYRSLTLPQSLAGFVKQDDSAKTNFISIVKESSLGDNPP
jgi:hypothetical protein